MLPVLSDRALSGEIAKKLAAPFAGKAEVVVAPEALSGGCSAKRSRRSWICRSCRCARAKSSPMRAMGLYRVAFMDYSGHRKSLETAKSAPLTGKRVLIVDEWIETGAQIMAVMALLKKFGAEVAGIAAIGVNRGPRTDAWAEAGLLTCIGRDF